ncbi:hypothetical protein PoB_007087500 [Plakobranchus ocellatus]|uniref:Uncharacterized protein n=1 Tax=Plakobranchus ocellatus TaxID=259542 RepID=A0AAV4DK30_9GAST|nr:hypothetical protein PoB_007087500 [Plakobranchus ocellatus]
MGLWDNPRTGRPISRSTFSSYRQNEAAVSLESRSESKVYTDDLNHRDKELCLSLSLALDVIKFYQKLVGENPDILQQLSLCRKTATYPMTQGVAEALTDDLFAKIQTHHFFMSVDKSTTNANSKFVNVIVRYFDDASQRQNGDTIFGKLQREHCDCIEYFCWLRTSHLQKTSLLLHQS